jgi:hypothetical protein
MDIPKRLAWGLLAVAAGTGAFAQDGVQWRAAPLATNAWQAIQLSAERADGGLLIRQGGPHNGYLIPLDAKLRSRAAVEADVVMRQRLGKDGWNFAGVSLFQDGENLWLLALVEGPDGSHTVDFIESREGVWQAQAAPSTALKREGNVSFAWQAGRPYRLRLVLGDGRVTACVSEPADGRVLGSASFTLGDAPAVRAGFPAVIGRASLLSVANFRFGAQPTAAGARARVALLDDALPGHDRAATARLADELGRRGFDVARLTAQQLLAPEGLSADAYQGLVVPQCDAVPVALGERAQQFAREGGALVVTGGPFLDCGLAQLGGAWLDREGLQQVLRAVKTEHAAFPLSEPSDVKAWFRSSGSRDTAASWRVVSEGPGGSACVRLDVADLQGWDVYHSPELPAVFGSGHELFTFLAKGDARSSQLAVEVIERDGSRWIATAPLSAEWSRVALRLEDFKYWNDSRAKGRGRAGDRLRPESAARVSLGFSSSHTPAVGGGAHTAWLADVGSARDPLAAAGVPVQPGPIEGVYPRYKVFGLSGELAFSQRVPAGCTNVVCAIPRTLGEGFGRGAKWRFEALTEARLAGGGAGACEWLLLNTRFPLAGSAVAGFGYTDPAVWSSPDVAARIAEAVLRVTRGVVLEEAGTERFAYWPGERVRCAVRLRAYADQDEPLAVAYELSRDGRAVASGQRELAGLKAGVAEVVLAEEELSDSGEYTFSCSLAGGRRFSHRLRVLDPKPAPKDAFITVRDGAFWLGGEKWYPVGVNYWPLYVAGMEHADYGAGWLIDAYYAPALVERDLAHMRDMGINMVSIQTPPRAGMRNLLDFLALCAKYGVHANLFVGVASPLAFNDEELKAYLAEGRLAGNAAVFAYDTIWEPGNHVFKDDEARARWDGAWRAWLEERYGSVERAERDWGVKARRDKSDAVISPPDAWFREDGAWRVQMAAYRRFMDNLTSQLWGRANRRLRELDPNHLISFRQGNTLPYDFALSGPVKHIDFICPEGYSIRDTDEGEAAIGFITRYVDHTTRGKPVVWSEFGQSVWDAARLAPDAGAVERQGRYQERFYRTGLAAGAVGTVPWWWVGGYRVDENSDFGIVAPDGRERPSAKLIRDYAARFKAPREKPQLDAWFAFDRDAHAGGYWRAAFHEGAAAWRAAADERKSLGVRTAGTGKDQTSAPLVAVGNVPCDGTNPPKYLDAEFNWLQILNADGVWQEAEDGAVIAVATNRPVRARASVGNTQEATWSEERETFVSLAVCAQDGGRRLGNHFLPHDGRKRMPVPYLGDADFGEFDLFGQRGEVRQPALPATVSVRMGMESRARVPFGEARVFTLVASARRAASE